MFTVYGLYSRSFNKIYVGFTSDIENRLFAHNYLGSKGWTKKFQPWELVYSEQCATKQSAMKREKELKTAKGRQVVWDLINSI